MSSPPDGNARILAAAEAIADGRPIDWATLDVKAADPAAQHVLDELRVLAALADVHRSPDPTVLLAAGDEPTMAVRDPTPREGWGSFRLLEELGHGTFGTVYRARDPRLDREVALKLIAARAGSPDTASAVVDEGRLLAKLRHPNIVTVFGADIVDGVVGLWMELLRGRTLKEELASRGPLGAREAAVVGIDLAHALAAVHRAGLVHRDIKAQNVMREEGGRIVLMDFGAGRDLQSREDRPLSVAGTPMYMAPELLAGQPATPSSDLYSLGVLLYHLVTGEFPVEAQTMGELRAAHAAGRRRHLRDVRPDLPSAFIQAVESATAALPSARVSSAAALEHDLARVLQGLGGPAKTSDERQPGKWTDRWWMLVAPLLLIATLAWWNGWGIARGVRTDAGISSILVLPFSNLTGQADQEYLADGVTEILIGNLAQLRSIRVISRTSAMSYKGTRKPLATIAHELNVDGIIEGSVARSGDRLRVVVQLVRANERHVWGQTYERPAADLFRVQGEISGMVADAIKLSLTPAERKSLTAAPAVQVQAQDAFLRGLQRLNDFQPESLRAALADLQEAVRLDPTSARAFAALSQCYLLAGTRDIMTRDESYAKALTAATRALQLDDAVAQAHTQLAEVKFYFEWDWQAARARLRACARAQPEQQPCAGSLLVVSFRPRRAGRRPEIRHPRTIAGSDFAHGAVRSGDGPVLCETLRRRHCRVRSPQRHPAVLARGQRSLRAGACVRRAGPVRRRNRGDHAGEQAGRPADRVDSRDRADPRRDRQPDRSAPPAGRADGARQRRDASQSGVHLRSAWRGRPGL